MAFHFIIEHKGKGPYLGHERDNGGDMTPSFRRAVKRTDFEVRQFPTRPEAERELDRVRRSVPGCYIVPVKG